MTRPYMAPKPLRSSLPKAVGYLRLELSGSAWERAELDLLELAGQHGYDLVKTLRIGPEVREPVSRLLIVVRRFGAGAVVTPTLEHVGTPEVIRRACHLIVGEPGLILPRLHSCGGGR
ncbi:hypothetical protein OHB26_02215 [Nocardia sp. NBC_01503]|uniref:hypothetical protein n=1 Tax=Nocardia sp. NBC_01503 TaxID=2975997 RepID=UPI002E7C3F5B|nr:hypothetical protein [Nocardia sp. NBC_01503]WTL33093.1 hypothetical protein OHB26_02215 [Nocardia sp. NBC_01503]